MSEEETTTEEEVVATPEGEEGATTDAPADATDAPEVTEEVAAE